MKDIFVHFFFQLDMLFFQFNLILTRPSHVGNALRVVHDVVRQIDKELSKASLSCSVIS